MLGTPGYMAPEQATGADDVDARADVFALGCVLFECISGRPAFMGGPVLAVLAKILLADVPRLWEIVPAVPLELDSLVARMLTKHPGDRFADGRAVELALAQIALLRPTGVPRTVSGQMRASRPTAIGRGEQRLLSVVLVGSTRARAEDAATLNETELDARREGVGEIARAHGGRAERLIDGTTIVTLGGEGVATELAARAARCALALRAMAEALPVALVTGRGSLEAGVPIGEAIDRGVELLRRARGEGRIGVRLDPTTAGLLDERFPVDGDEAGLFLLAESLRTEAGRTLLGTATPFVGREREMGRLVGLYDECVLESAPRAALIVGAAGVGKSRLRRHLVEQIEGRGQGAQVLVAKGDPLSAGAPFVLAAELVRTTAGLSDALPVSVRKARLRARVARQVDDAHVDRIATFLAELMGIRVETDGDVQLAAARADRVLMGDQMRRAFEDFLLAEVETGPIVLVLEDLQWGDRPSLAFVEGALRTLAGKPLFVLALGRAEVETTFPGVFADLAVERVELGELPRKAAERLCIAVLGDADSERIARVVGLAGGNALHLEEVLRAMASGSTALPETLLAMVQGRIESLDPDARRILRAASVLGQEFRVESVAALLGDPDPTELGRHLDGLVAREIVAVRPHGFAFRNATLRDAAYAMLTEEDRRLGHALAGALLEQSGRGLPIAMAEHFERGGDPGRAEQWYRRAAEQALEGNDFDAVIARSSRAVACGASGEALGEVRILAGEARRWRGEHDLAAADAEDARSLLIPGSARWCDASGLLVTERGARGDKAGVLEVCEALAAVALDASNEAPWMMAMARATMQVLFGGSYDVAERLLLRMDAVGSRDDPRVMARRSQAAGMHALFTGDALGCLQHNVAAAEAFERAGDLRNVGMQRINVGHACMELGLYDDAESSLRQALESADRLGVAYVHANARHNLGLVLAHLGRLDEARVVERSAVDAAVLQGDRLLEGASRTYLARILLMSNALLAAEDEARAAIDALAGSPPVRAMAQAILAEVLLAEGRTREAHAVVEAARAKLEELETIGEGEVLVRLACAEVARALGNRDESRRHLAQARAHIEKRAERIADPDYRRRFVEDVADHARLWALEDAWR